VTIGKEVEALAPETLKAGVEFVPSTRREPTISPSGRVQAGRDTAAAAATPSVSASKLELLHTIRWLAAGVVLIGHCDLYMALFGDREHPRQLFGYLGMHAHAAVIVFFVLSGYVVSFATERKLSYREYSFRDYFLDRWSRIYSVLLAAIAFTLAIDRIGAAFRPVYRDPIYVPQDSFAVRLLVNLFAVQGVQGYRIQLGTNAALWSIGYEFVFYILFGLIFFGRKLTSRRWVPLSLAGVLLALVGGKMTGYFCVWSLGVLAYHLSRKRAFSSISVHPVLALITLWTANHVLIYENMLHASQFVQDASLAVAFALLLTFEIKPGFPSHVRWKWLNNYMAEFSYSLYSFHLPLLFFLFAMSTNYMLHGPRLAVCVVLVVPCLLLGRLVFVLSESRRAVYRRFAAQVLAKLRWA
jgi:peptidoglycan/LPS O-acetylase OafA/YrhL